MPRLDTILNNFSAGELSPLALGRTDFIRYRLGAKILENWEVLLQGGVRTRPGTRYVAPVKFPTGTTILLPFEPSEEQAYVLEAGALYFRFYTAGTRLEVTGTPVEVATPYTADQLRSIRHAQANDIMVLAHGSHSPRLLSRLTPNTFSFSTARFSPPPTFQAGSQPDATLTPSALTGAITLTASSGVFLAADVQRVISSGASRVVITSLVSDTVVNATTLTPFTSTATIAAGAWAIEGTPVARCKPDIAAPQGAVVTLELLAEQGHGADLVTDGDFLAGIGGWTDLSGPVMVSGTHTGVNNSADLVVSAAAFRVNGVQVGHLVTNSTDGSWGRVSTFANSGSLDDTIVLNPTLDGGTEDDFDTGDAFTVRQTGYARFSLSENRALLNGEAAGVGWIERPIATISGVTYEAVFDVQDAPASFMVGAITNGSTVLAEAQYQIDNEHKVAFEAASATSYLGFRNNQPVEAALDNVTCRQLSVEGWRAEDIGKYVKMNGGLVQITAVPSAIEATGEIIRELTDTTTAPVDAWTLESASWSDALGWPSVVVLYEGRLYFAGSARFPQTIWGSAVDDLFNFFRGAEADDAVEFTIRDSGGNIVLNRIRSLMPAENMLALTNRAEYRLIGSGDDPLTPLTPPRVRVQSTYGSANIQPLKVGPSLIFVQRQGSAVREMAFQENTQSFVARNLTRLSGHLLASQRILELAYQSEPEPVLWALRDDGTLLGFTYDLLEEVEAWTRQTTAGSFESHAVIPHPTALADQRWVIANHGTGPTVEYFDPHATMTAVTPVDGVVPSWQRLTVDSAVTFAFATPTTALTGLDHLNGFSVAIVADGAVLPQQMVAGGVLTLPLAAKTVWVGHPFTCQGETLPIELQLQSGTIQRSRKRWAELTARINETIGLQINGEQIDMRTPEMFMSEGVPPQTNDFPITPPGGWDRQGTIQFTQTQPLPATLLALVGVLDVQAE